MYKNLWLIDPEIVTNDCSDKQETSGDRRAGTLLLDKEIMDITTRRKHTRDQRRKKWAELRTLKTHTQDSLGGGKRAPDGFPCSKVIHFKDTTDNASQLIDDYCNVSLEKIDPGQGERIKQKIRESDLNKTINNNPSNLRPEDLTPIVKQAVQAAQEPLKDKKRQTETKPRSSTPKYEWLSESDEQSDDSSKSTPESNKVPVGPPRRGQVPNRGRDTDQSVTRQTTQGGR